MAQSLKRKQMLAKELEGFLIKRIVFIVIITFIILGSLIFYGIPALVTFVDAWDTAKNSNVKKSNSNELVAPLSRPSFQSLPNSATNSADIVLKGFASAGSTVHLKINGVDFGNVVADNSGAFTYSKITLKEGDNTIIAFASDAGGRKSEESNAATIKFDTRPPTLDVTSPNPNEVFSGSGKNIIEIKGKTSEATQMYVNESWVILNSDGSFSYSYQIQPGESSLIMFAMDDAGNRSVQVERKVTFNP
ncbi:MAG: Ig-like domain-containing protein [bacterium]|nr:Ig-like domain-containing protein [bacterium]